MALTWSGFTENHWSEEEKEEDEESLLQAMTTAAQAKDAALQDLQKRLNAALAEVEQGRAREASLLRRAEISEEAEEALASQIAELEAEAFTRITQANKLLMCTAAGHVEPVTTSQPSTQVGELENLLKLALEDAAAWARRCQVLEAEAEEGRIREAAFQRRAEIAEKAEEALASQMAELEAEAFTRITENSKRCDEESQPIINSQVEELERRLAEAGQELEAVHAKLHQMDERARWLETFFAVQLAQEEEKGVMLKGKQREANGDTLLAVSLEDLAGVVKLKLWSPSSLALTSC